MTRQTRLIPLTKWPEYHPWPSKGALRQFVHAGDENGFSACVKRVGRRVLIDEQAFFAWVDAKDKEARAKSDRR